MVVRGLKTFFFFVGKASSINWKVPPDPTLLWGRGAVWRFCEKSNSYGLDQILIFLVITDIQDGFRTTKMTTIGPLHPYCRIRTRGAARARCQCHIYKQIAVDVRINVSLTLPNVCSYTIRTLTFPSSRSYP